VQIIFSDIEEVNLTMPKRNKQAMNPAANAAATQANTTTEFASETNVAEVRRQNQQSASRASQSSNPTE
jgi:small acid-soluble spore protein E (minor gamma-type SASP)